MITRKHIRRWLIWTGVGMSDADGPDALAEGKDNG